MAAFEKAVQPLWAHICLSVNFGDQPLSVCRRLDAGAEAVFRMTDPSGDGFVSVLVEIKRYC
jgi:hypothetical protein